MSLGTSLPVVWGLRCRCAPRSSEDGGVEKAQLSYNGALSGTEVAWHFSNTPEGISRHGVPQRSRRQSPTQLAEELLLEVGVIGMWGSSHHDSQAVRDPEHTAWMVVGGV